MLILLHTSKTMHKLGSDYMSAYTPQLLPKAEKLAAYLATLSTKQLELAMNIRKPLAEQVHATQKAWNSEFTRQRSAIYSFAGDIYSGLQVQTWTSADLDYAQKTLRILSGLYGVLRPLDGVVPYRLELGYKLPHEPYTNLYNYWGDSAANVLPETDLIIDLAAKEYSKLVLPFIPNKQVISPKFLTVNAKTGKPSFVVVHAKIARGAFAAWLVKNKIQTSKDILAFNDLGYRYNKALSTPQAPVFVCKNFGGIGLSVRLAHK